MSHKYIFIIYMIIGNSISSTYAMQETESFLRGSAPVIAGMVLGYLSGGMIKHEYIGTFTGGIGGAVVDHYYLGGKEDPHYIARKSGNAAPIIVGGAITPIIVGGAIILNNSTSHANFPFTSGSQEIVIKESDQKNYAILLEAVQKGQPDLLKGSIATKENIETLATSFDDFCSLGTFPWDQKAVIINGKHYIVQGAVAHILYDWYKQRESK